MEAVTGAVIVGVVWLLRELRAWYRTRKQLPAAADMRLADEAMKDRAELFEEIRCLRHELATATKQIAKLELVLAKNGFEIPE